MNARESENYLSISRSPVHQKVSRFFGPRYIGDDFCLGANLVPFNRTVVPYEISKVIFREEAKNINISKTS